MQAGNRRAAREHRPLADLHAELARLGTRLEQQERALAGSLEPEAGELLRRLAGATRAVQAASDALLGVVRLEPAPQEEHLRGSSRTVPMQELLSFLATTQKSGVLRVEAEHERFLVQLDEGAVVYASGDDPPPGEALRELLQARGVASAELLGSFTNPGTAGGADARRAEWVDRNLVGTSWISRDPLLAAIQEQTRLSFFRLCAASHTRFRFYEGAEIENVLPVRQNAMELLLEYSRAQDERSEQIRFVCRARAALPAEPHDEAEAAPSAPGISAASPPAG